MLDIKIVFKDGTIECVSTPEFKWIGESRIRINSLQTSFSPGKVVQHWERDELENVAAVYYLPTGELLQKTEGGQS